MPLGEKIKDDIWNMHAKCHEFSLHRNGDINLSLSSFFEFCTLEEQDLMRFDCMKDVVLDNGIPSKFISYISELYFLCYGFSKFMNEQVQVVHIREPLAASFTHGAGAGHAAHQQPEENGVSPHRREEARSRKMALEVGACRKLVSRDSSSPQGGRRCGGRR
jgi:hypothetical protein